MRQRPMRSSSRRRDAAAPPPPLLPQGMLSGQELFTISARCEQGIGSNDDVRRLLDHIAAADRLLGLLYDGIRQGETARAYSFRAPRHRDGWEGIGKTTTRDAIQHLSAVLRQPNGVVADGAFARLQSTTLRQASLAMIIDNVPGSERAREYLKQRADEIERGKKS